jgi:hypothetical protein
VAGGGVGGGGLGGDWWAGPTSLRQPRTFGLPKQMRTPTNNGGRAVSCAVTPSAKRKQKPLISFEIRGFQIWRDGRDSNPRPSA